jgi:RNA polymerase sigma-70 factor (ECF subfamily)
MRLVRRWLELLGIPRLDRRDLAHDVAAAALRSAPRYRPERATPERWINAITVHTVSKWLDRARHRREVLSAAPPERATAAPPPDVMIAAEEERAGLMAALEEVDPAAAAVLVAHDLDGERAVEIAARGGLPLGTVYTRHRRGMRVLAKVLLRRFRSLGNVAAPVLGRAALSAAGPRRREA